MTKSRGVISRIYGHSGVFFVVAAVSQAINVLVLPLLANSLSLDEYGLLTNLMAVKNLLIAVTLVGVVNGFGRYVYDAIETPEQLREAAATTLGFWLVWLTPATLLSAAGVWIMLSNLGEADWTLSFLVAAGVLVRQGTLIHIRILKARLDTIRFGVLEVAYVVLFNGAVVFLVVFKDMGVRAYFAADLVVCAVFLAVHCVIMARQAWFQFRWASMAFLKKSWKYGIGYLPLTLSGWVAQLSDRYVIAYFLGLSASGKYAFAYQVAMLITIVIQSIDSAFFPQFNQWMKGYHVGKNKADLGRVEYVIELNICIALGLYLVVCLVGPWMVEWLFPVEYQGDYHLLAIIGLGLVFLAFRRLFIPFLIFHEKALWISAASYLPAVLNLVLNILLVPIFGVDVAAWTTLGSFVAYALTIIALSLRLTPYHLRWSRLCLLLAIAVVFAGLGIRSVSAIANLGMLIGFAAVAAVLILRRSGLSTDEPENPAEATVE